MAPILATESAELTDTGMSNIVYVRTKKVNDSPAVVPDDSLLIESVSPQQYSDKSSVVGGQWNQSRENRLVKQILPSVATDNGTDLLGVPDGSQNLRSISLPPVDNRRFSIVQSPLIMNSRRSSIVQANNWPTGNQRRNSIYQPNDIGSRRNSIVSNSSNVAGLTPGERRSSIYQPNDYSSRRSSIYQPNDYSSRRSSIYQPNDYSSRRSSIYQPNDYSSRRSSIYQPNDYSSRRGSIVSNAASNVADTRRSSVDRSAIRPEIYQMHMDSQTHVYPQRSSMSGVSSSYRRFGRGSLSSSDYVIPTRVVSQDELENSSEHFVTARPPEHHRLVRVRHRHRNEEVPHQVPPKTPHVPIHTESAVNHLHYPNDLYASNQNNPAVPLSPARRNIRKVLRRTSVDKSYM